jgi:hypothetical protein
MTTGWVESDELDGGVSAAADIWDRQRATAVASARPANWTGTLYLGFWDGNALNLARFTSIDLTSAGAAA